MKLKVFMLLMTTFVLIGCGSSGSKVDPVKEKKKDGDSPTVDIPDKNATPKTMLNAKYSVDGKGIKGIPYSCEDNTTGITLKDGNFTYAKDVSKICAFSINDINLTRVDTLNITPGATAIVSPNEDSKRVLKSLDDDANVSNGITILPGVISALDGKLSGVPSDYAGLVTMVGYLNGVAGYHGKPFSDTPAMMAVKIIGFKPSKEYLYDENISLEANVTNALHSLTYLWKVGTDTSTSDNLLIDNLSVGTHDINLTVTDTENNTIANDGVRITVSDYVVIIKPIEKVYKKDETVTLEADVTGTVATLGYAWSDKHTKWKDDILDAEGSDMVSDTFTNPTTKILTHKFSIGHHKVTVKVSANSIDKSAIFDFDVIDDTDFNRTLSTNGKDRVIIHKNLMWVDQPEDLNATDGKSKCAKIHKVSENNSTLNADEFELGKSFCNHMTFFGKNDWRTPIPSELKTFIDDSIKQNFLSIYDDKCARLLAITDTSHPEANASYTSVMTRYSSSPATDSNLTPNIGIRCVRTLP